MTTGDCVVASLQSQAQGDWDVEAQVSMICSVVVESQKGWNGLRSGQAPTCRPNLGRIGFLYQE